MKDPIKNFVFAYYPGGSITQFFGENPDLYKYWGLKAHNGIDIVAPHGEPLYAVESGKVVYIKNDPNGFGKYIKILSDANTDGRYREWTYGHMSAIHVNQGDRVEAGQRVGLMGNTGFTVSNDTPYWSNNPYAGTHLHLGLRESTADWKILNYDNGYKGAVDPAPYFEEASFEDTAKGKQMLTLISLANTTIGLLKKLVALK